MNFTCMSQFSLKRQHSIHLHEVWILINMLNFTNNTHICVDKKSSYTYLLRWMIKPISNVSSAWPKYFEWYINIEVVVLYFITIVLLFSRLFPQFQVRVGFGSSSSLSSILDDFEPFSSTRSSKPKLDEYRAQLRKKFKTKQKI